MAAAAPPPPPTPPSTTGLEGVMTLSAALRHRAQQFPDKAAFIFRSPNNNSDERRVLTYGDLHQLGGRWARFLHSRGIGRGQFVLNTLPNSPERAVVDSAILLSGAACVNGVCQLEDASDLITLLRQSAAVALVLDPDFMPDVYAALLRDVSEPRQGDDDDDGAVTSESLPALKFLFLVRRRGEDDTNPTEDFMSSLKAPSSRAEYEEAGDVFYEEDVKEDDVCMVFTTSGSSGFPKLVVFTHGPLVALVKSLNRPPNSVEFSVSLMGWVSGYFGNIVLAGTTRVLCDARAGLPEDFPLFILKSVKEEGVTSGSVPIHLLPAVAEKVDALNASQPIFGVMGLGAQPITKQVIKEASRVARMLVSGYASTEVMFVSAAFPVNVDTFEDYFVGRPVAGVEVKVCDERGQKVEEANVRGEILVKSPFRFREYLNDPQTTVAAFTKDGFFRTGDVGWLDAEGRLYAEGRSKDAIMRGRRVVYPGGLESRILNCQAVRDVMVVGVPDAMLQNELCVCVVLKSEAWCLDDVKRYVEKEIREDYTDSQSMRPRYYLTFDSLPVTSTGKPHRAEVKKVAERRILEDQKSSSGKT